MKRIRCSSNPLLEACAQSGERPAVDVIGDDGPASHGSMAHELFFDCIMLGRGYPSEGVDLAVMAERWGADPKEASMLAGAAWRLWQENELAGVFPEPEFNAEITLVDEKSGIIETGHLDLNSLVSREVRVLDLKTGRLDINPVEQLKAYSLGSMRKYDADTAYAAQLRPRDGVFEAWQWTRDELEAWWQRFVEHLGRGEYRTGEHCTRCHRWLECPAATQLVQASAARLLSAQAAATVRVVSPAGASLTHAVVPHAVPGAPACVGAPVSCVPAVGAPRLLRSCLRSWKLPL